MNLANELLPSLPQGTISLPTSTNLLIKGSVVKKPSAGGSTKQEETNLSTQEVSAREKLLNDQPELLQQFGIDLLPVLIQVGIIIHCKLLPPSYNCHGRDLRDDPCYLFC